MAGKRRRTGVPGRVKHIVGRGGGNPRTETRSVMKTAEELQRVRERFYAMFIALNFTGREHFTEEGIVEIPLYDNDPVWEDKNDNDGDFRPMPPPPGEEDALNSHDTEGMYDTVLTGLLGHKKQYHNTRTQRDCTEKQTQAWERQHE
ncbi:hypothetical protein PM082_006155 [Marasmius tenuissimus]|nr:hypothetical protein PM082_006155 [Marasmius tenuissimus]